jgi:hypothetical protein
MSVDRGRFPGEALRGVDARRVRTAGILRLRKRGQAQDARQGGDDAEEITGARDDGLVGSISGRPLA